MFYTVTKSEEKTHYVSVYVSRLVKQHDYVPTHINGVLINLNRRDAAKILIDARKRGLNIERY